MLGKHFEQRIAGLRLEKEQVCCSYVINPTRLLLQHRSLLVLLQTKMDKALLRRLEREMSDLKSLSTSVLGPLSHWRQSDVMPDKDV